MAHAVMLVTAASTLTLTDGTEHPTGFWAEELAELYDALRRAGHHVTIATPAGSAAPVDPASLPVDDRLSTVLTDLAPQLAAAEVLAQIADGSFDALVVPGGHGPMADLASDPDVARLLADADRRGAIIGVLCHGPAVLLSGANDGGLALSGRRLTAFSDEEELSGGLGDRAPYLVARELRARGAEVTSGAPWSSTVVVDGNLISGQNPQSSRATAEAIVAALAQESMIRVS